MKSDAIKERQVDRCEEGPKGGARNRRSARGRNKRPNRNCRNVDSDDKRFSESEIFNDPAWRKIDDVITKDVVSYPFTQFSGRVMTIRPSVTNGTKGEYSNPGVMVLYNNPAVGCTAQQRDAVNQAAMSLFTQLSANNMKTTQYGPEDVMITLLALSDIAAKARYIKRAFGYLGTANYRNWYYPKYIIQAMGIDYDDFIANVTPYRERFNYMMKRAQVIPFPKNVNYLDSQGALYDDIYLDSETPTAQSYMFVPRSGWTFNETGSSQGPYLGTTDWVLPGTIKKLSHYLNLLQQAIDVMLDSANLQYLYADILKYTEKREGVLYVLPQIDSTYALAPVYSVEALGVIENTRCLSDPVETEVVLSQHPMNTLSNDVYTSADDHSIRYYPIFKLVPEDSQTTNTVKPQWTWTSNPVLNFHTGSPSEDEKLMATRMQFLALDYFGVNSEVYIRPLLSDNYVSDIKVYSMEGDTFKAKEYYNLVSAKNAQFKRRPLQTQVFVKNATTPATASVEITGIRNDMDYYTQLEANALEAILSSSMYALLMMR